LAEVQVINGESLESALKRFKRKVLNEDIIKDIKRHAFYLKPGQKMRSRRRWPGSAVSRTAREILNRITIGSDVGWTRRNLRETIGSLRIINH
jgi:small subunit ribosomal protein S21